MYILNHRRKQNRTLLAFSLLVIGIGGAAYLGRQLIATETTIGPSPAAVVTRVEAKRKAPKQIDKPLFKFELPADWEEFTATESLAGSQNWRNTADNKGVRTISIVTDGTMGVKGVNRIVPAEASQDSIRLVGDVSDNCVNFTTPSKQSASNGTATAKWQGVEFVCDTGNYVRNVAAVGVAGLPAGIKLTGSTTGQHTYIIVYNDANATPNYTIFSDMLQSFKAK